MPTKQEIQAQIDALTKQLDTAGDDGAETELWVKDEKGRETRLTGAHAKRWLKNLGLEDDASEGGEGDGGGDPPQDPPPSGAESVWGRKK
jgi:hypothetical protein